MREELLIVIELKRLRESECEVRFQEFVPIPLVLIWVVIDVFTSPVPADTLLVLQLIGEAQDLHSIIVKRVWLGQVQHVELDCFSFPCVAHSEEVPLSVPIGIDIVLQYQVVFVISHFDRSKQIARLKS